MPVSVTDDEIVALVINGKKSWMAALPTVNVQDSDALIASGVRGLRSLAVRGMVPGRSSNESAALRAAKAIETVAGEFARVMTFAASLTEPTQALGTVATLLPIPESGDYLIDLVNPIGIHEVDRLSAAAAQEWIDSAIARAWEGTLWGEEPADPAFIVVRPSTGSVTAVATGRVLAGALSLEPGEASMTLEEAESGTPPAVLL